MNDVEQRLLSDIIELAKFSKCSLLEVELARLTPANDTTHACYDGLLAIDGKIERWGISNGPDPKAVTERLERYATNYPSFLLFDDFFSRSEPLVRRIAEGGAVLQTAGPMLQIRKHDPVETHWRKEWNEKASQPQTFLHDAWESWVDAVSERWRENQPYNLSCMAVGARFAPLGSEVRTGTLDPLKHSAAIFATVSHDARPEDVALLYYRAQARLYAYLGGQLLQSLEKSLSETKNLFNEVAENQAKLKALNAELEANHSATRRLLDEERERWGFSDEMRADLKELLNAVATARGRALRIESRMDKSKQNFLRLYTELRLLFNVDGEIVVTRDHAGKTILHTSHDTANQGADDWSLSTIHSATSKDLPNRWPGYVKLLHQYRETTDVDLLGWFHARNPETFARQFNLLKLLLQRIHLRNEGLFPVQLLAASLMAVQNHAAPVTVRAQSVVGSKVNFQYAKPRDIDVRNLVEEMTRDATLAPWLEAERQPERGVIAGTATPSSVVGAIMSLLGNELRSKTAADMMATAETIDIRETATSLEFSAICRGRLNKPDVLKDLSQGGDRSLRSVLKTLCESINQQQLLLVDTADIDHIDQIRARLRDPQCIVGDDEANNRTIFSIAWRRQSIK